MNTKNTARKTARSNNKTKRATTVVTRTATAYPRIVILHELDPMAHGQDEEVFELLRAAMHRVHSLQQAFSGETVRGAASRRRRRGRRGGGRGGVVDEATVHGGVEALNQLVLLCVFKSLFVHNVTNKQKKRTCKTR